MHLTGAPGAISERPASQPIGVQHDNHATAADNFANRAALQTLCASAC
jgi:hypothetical protein